MKLPRRTFLHLATGAAALPAVSRIARAQAYPTRPVRFIVGFTPGGSFDITARLIGQWLSERLGQQFVIENRPGAAGNIASEAAVKSPADGYTILLCGVPNAISATLYDKLNYNFARDIAPVGAVSRAPNVMVVHPSVPAKTVPEFIAYAKANPGKVNMASSGVGTSLHLSGELFKLMTGVNMQHVPYRGSAPMLTDLLAGQVQIAFDNLQPSVPHIKAGTLRALAVTTATRSDALPDLPTVADFVPGYERARGMACARRRIRRPRSLKGSIGRSMRHSPIRRSTHGLPRWARRRFQVRPPTMASFSPMKSRSGARSSGRATSSRNRSLRLSRCSINSVPRNPASPVFWFNTSASTSCGHACRIGLGRLVPILLQNYFRPLSAQH
jgi:tripartite-type tricarboxylate transporter receptor subunit TctC